MRADVEDPGWEDEPGSRRSSSGGSSSSASPPGAFELKTLTQHLTHGTARTLNTLAALLVIAGLILVAQVGAPQIGWAGGRVGSRGVAVLDIGADTGATGAASRASSFKQNDEGVTTKGPPSRTWTFKEKKGEGLVVPARPKKNNTLSLKTTGAHDTWGRKFYTDDSPANLLAALVAKTDATDGKEWSTIPSVQRQLEAFAQVCGDDMLNPKPGSNSHGKPTDGRTFIKALAEYTRLYEDLWAPNLEADRRTRPRVLIVRDFQARRQVGAGHQQEYLARWLMFGMATNRAVFFQFCAESGEPWEELYPSAFNPPPPSCDAADGYFDLGDHFRLMGGIDVRWNASTAARLRAVDSAGTHAGLTVVGACNDREGHVAHGDSPNDRIGGSADENTKRMFTCDCCESCDLATETYDGNLPARYMDRFKKFWSDEREQANHPVIAFEYRSECAKYRTAMAHRDDPAHSWYTQDMPVLLKHLASRRPNDGPIPEDWETDTLDGESRGPGGQKGGNVPLEFRSVGVEGSRWGHCARFAMTTPSPTTQIASLPTLRKLTALGEHRPLVGFHARTLAVDVPACMPPTTEVSWKAVDDAFSRLSVGGASPETCRQTPYTCRGGLMFWPDVFGSLSGFFDCAKRVASLGLPLTSLETSGSYTSIRTRTGDVDVNEPARVFATTDSAVVHELLEHDDDVVVFGNASSLVVPTWNGFSSVTAEKLSNVGPSGEVSGDGSANQSISAEVRTIDADTRRASWLKAAVDFYVLSLTDVIVAPTRSSFGDGAARRGFPFKAVLGQLRDSCDLITHLAHEPSKRANGTGVDALIGLDRCFKGLRVWGLDLGKDDAVDDSLRALYKLNKMGEFRRDNVSGHEKFL